MVLKTRADVVAGNHGMTALIETILWKDIPWLVAGRQCGRTAKTQRPTRLVRPRLFRFLKPTDHRDAADYYLTVVVPKRILDGKPTLEETKVWEIVEAPDIELSIPNAD